ncbi:MAG: M42 family peptidase [Clostridia bacterium]|nr:M42 family peptidase [Clostridia bacterium]
MNREFLKELLNTATVSGCEEAGQEKALAFARPFAHRQLVDAAGNALSIVNPDAPCRVLLCGHIDEIGFRVTHIDGDGLIHVQKAGGVRPALYVGSPMQIIHETEEDGRVTRRKVAGVGVVTDDLLKKKDVDDGDLIIDIGASSKEEAEAVVSLGDPVCADTAVRQLLGDRLSSRALDDKAGAFVILEAARKAAEAGAPCGIWAGTIVGEETSGRGAYYAAANAEPSCAVVVDVTWVSDCPGTNPADTGPVKLGGGPVLCRSGMVNKKLNRLMEQIAAEKGIPLQYEIAGGRTYTDGDTVFKTGRGVPVVLVSVPLRYMHSSVEVASWRDIEQCVDLIAGFLMRIDASFDYRPLTV